MKPAVLVVDDESSIAEALRLILERDGYVVETAGNIAEASTRTDGRDFAVASTLFYRDSLIGKVGRQMQSWVRFEDGWKVVAAHVSIIDAPKT